MHSQQDLEQVIRSHLVAEAENLHPLPTREAVLERLTVRRQRWRMIRLGSAAAAILVLAMIGGRTVFEALRPDVADNPGQPAAATGPLAVRVVGIGGELAGMTGTLRITDKCVFVQTTSVGRVLIAWPANSTSWDAADRSITFINRDGSVVTLRDREFITMTGGGDRKAESGISPQDWVASTDWLATPDSSCVFSAWWTPNEVRAGTE